MTELAPWQEHSNDFHCEGCHLVYAGKAEGFTDTHCDVCVANNQATNVTNCNNGEATMAKSTNKPVDQIQALTELFGELSDIPKMNVMQRLMNSLVQQVAQAQHFADRIELGDDAVHDANGQRPGIDGQPNRVLSERQAEIIQKSADDEDAAITALLELKGYYEACFGDKPQYSLRQDAQGGWHPILDYSDAVAHEYRLAHQRWERKLAEKQAEADQQQGAMHLAAQRRQQAASKASKL